jgi:hypothetical protein
LNSVLHNRKRASAAATAKIDHAATIDVGVFVVDAKLHSGADT